MPATTFTAPPPNLGGLLVTWPERLVGPASGCLDFDLYSDLHLGGQNTDHDLIQRELAVSKRDSARILINGDVFDLILPGDKKRYGPAALHPRLQGPNDIINKVVDWGFEMLNPVAELIDLIGCGNHDTTPVKHCSVDPVLLLVDKLNDALAARGSSHQIAYGGYAGFVCYRLGLPEGPPNDVRFNLFYHHGWGKTATLRSSAGQFLDLSFIEGCDVYWLGHLHARLQAHLLKLTPPACVGEYEPVLRNVRFVRTGAYIHSYGGQSPESLRREGRKANYGADGGCAPHGLGGARVSLELAPASRSFSLRVTQ